MMLAAEWVRSADLICRGVEERGRLCRCLPASDPALFPRGIGQRKVRARAHRWIQSPPVWADLFLNPWNSRAWKFCPGAWNVPWLVFGEDDPEHDIVQVVRPQDRRALKLVFQFWIIFSYVLFKVCAFRAILKVLAVWAGFFKLKWCRNHSKI